MMNMASVAAGVRCSGLEYMMPPTSAEPTSGRMRMKLAMPCASSPSGLRSTWVCQPSDLATPDNTAASGSAASKGPKGMKRHSSSLCAPPSAAKSASASWSG
jgi:hypothetical protein